MQPWNPAKLARPPPALCVVVTASPSRWCSTIPKRGTQLPKGTVESGEAIDAAVHRELEEESGISGARVDRMLGVWSHRTATNREIWHVALVSPPPGPPNAWTHAATGSVEEERYVFAFRWVAVDERLAGQLHPLFEECAALVREAVAKPLLLVDVDGVLFPWRAASCPESFEEYRFPGEEPVWLSLRHGHWLNGLAARYELVWATGWGDDANRLLGPVLGLPELPLVAFPPVPFAPAEKVPAIARYTAGRAVAWLDDQHTAEAYTWAGSRQAPTLLIPVEPSVGLTEEMVRTLEAWLV